MCFSKYFSIPKMVEFHRKISYTGRGVVLAKKQFSPTVSFSASAREFPSDFFTIIKGRRTKPSVLIFIEFHCEISLKSGKNPTAPHILSYINRGITCVGSPRFLCRRTTEESRTSVLVLLK